LQAGPLHAQQFGDAGPTDTLGQEVLDFRKAVVQVGAAGTLGPSYQLPLGPRLGQTHAGAFRDQLAFDFSEETQHGDQGGGGDVTLAVDHDPLLDDDHGDLLAHKLINERDDLPDAAAQAGEFRYDDGVAGLHGIDQIINPALLGSPARRHLHFHPGVDAETLAVGVVEDRVALVIQILAIGGDTKVGGDAGHGENPLEKKPCDMGLFYTA